MGFRFLIHPPGWALAESHISHELLPFAESPVVALTRFEDRKWRYFERGALDREDIDDALKQATAYIDNQDTKWNVEETNGFLGFRRRPTRASATGGGDIDLIGKHPTDRVEYGLTMKLAGAYVADDFLPEQLLSPRAMQQITHEMESESLILIIPQRGALIAAPGRPTDKATVQEWAKSALQKYTSAGETAICPHVFFAQSGKIVGCSLVQPDGSSTVSLSDVDPADWYV